MSLKLERPLVCFDLETTGLNTSIDRIVSLSIIKIFPDGSSESKTKLINPECNIPQGATLVHGISDEDVKDAPKFKQISKGIFEFIKGCDLLTYNGDNYDIPLLSEEFARCGITFPEEGIHSVDSCTIFKKKHPRNLEEALMFYCDEKIEGAHNSEVDTLATKKVFYSQILKYDDLQGMSIKELSEFCKVDTRVDLKGTILLDSDGDYVYGIGKSKGIKVKKDPSFCHWMLNNDFSHNTKSVIHRVLSEIENGK